MTAPDDPAMPPVDPEPPASPSPVRPGRPEPELVAWARAVARGMGDTARDMLAAGRAGAREAQDHAWERYRSKTRYRRKPPTG